MIRLIGEHWEGDVRVRWYGDDATNEVTVERWQDPTKTLDAVASVNSEGGIRTVDGMGKALADIPQVVAMQWADERGIPWEKLIYSDEYDDEFKRMVREFSKFAFVSPRAFA